MINLKELFFAKFDVCTNFDLELDADTIKLLKNQNQSDVENKIRLYTYLQKLVDQFSAPAIFYYGTHNIKGLEKLLICQKLNDQIKKHGLNFYIFDLLTTYHIYKKSVEWYCEYNSSEEGYIRSKELDSIESFCSYHNIKYVTVYTIEDNIEKVFQQNYQRLNLKRKGLQWPFKTSHLDFTFTSTGISKKIWCGNKRYATHRHIIASYIISTTPLTDVNLSWFCDSYIEHLTERINLNRFKEKKNQILRGVTMLDNIAPLTFEVDLKSKLSIRENFQIEFFDQNTEKSYKESFCTIVTETRFFQSTTCVTEKIINPIINKKFFIIVAPPETLKHLKTLGFKTFDKWIDESYDSEYDHIKRLEKIFNLIDYINSKSIDDLRTIYEEMESIIIHNIKTLQIIGENFFQKQVTAINQDSLNNSIVD
jgi:hypothetical protein